MSKKVTDVLSDKFFENPDFQEAINAFAETRKKKRAPLTEYALKLILRKLHELSEDNVEVAIRIVEQSIMNGWQGVFALKQEDQTMTQEFSRKREQI